MLLHCPVVYLASHNHHDPKAMPKNISAYDNGQLSDSYLSL